MTPPSVLLAFKHPKIDDPAACHAGMGVTVPWLNADDFKRYLYGMDLLLQPSFTETFNNITADGCACGVPSVVSDAIDWVPESWIAKADSAVDVADVACSLLRDKNAATDGWKSLDKHNTTALAAWRQWIAAP